MNFSNLISFLFSPFGIAILIGVGSLASRIWKYLQEQQVKRQVEQRRKLHALEELRTGSARTPKFNAQNVQESVDILPPPQTQQSAVSKNAARQERIEKLRAQRNAQLERLRRAKSGQAQSQPTVPQPNPELQRRQREIEARKQQIAEQRAHKQAEAQRKQDQRRRVSTQKKRAADPSRPQTTKPSPRRRDPNEVRLGSIPAKSSPDRRGSKAREMIRKDLKRAVIAKEILGPPIGLRSPNDGQDSII